MVHSKTKSRAKMRPSISVDVEKIRQNLQAKAAETAPGAKVPSGVPLWIGKLSVFDNEAREQACQCLTHLVLDAANAETLAADGVHMKLAEMLAKDQSASVRHQASTALRNMAHVMGAEVCDVLAAGPANGEWEIVDAVARNCAECALQLSVTIQAKQRRDTEAGGVAVEDEAVESDMTNVVSGMEEILLCAAALAEHSDALSERLASNVAFLAQMSPALVTKDIPEVQCAAAECLFALSEDTPAVGQFLATGFSVEQQAELNATIDTLPVSPVRRRIAMALCGALLNAAPSPANATRALPHVVAALEDSVLDVIRRALPLTTANSVVADAVRVPALGQAMDRLRSSRAACDVLHSVIVLLCETHDEDADDEEAFAANPHAALLREAGVVERVVARAAELIPPLPDATLQGAMRCPNECSDLTALQNLFASVEVAVFGVASALCVLIPLEVFGPPAALWAGIAAGVSSRLDLLAQAALGSGDTNGVPPVGACVQALPLQLQPLLDMAWTVQRKDDSGVTAPAAGHVDAFTRCAWLSTVSTEGRVAAVGAVGCIAARATDLQLHHACANFCCRVVAACAASAETMEIASEAADKLIDMFSDERFDASAYVPLNVHTGLSAFVPQLKAHLASMPKTRKGSPLSMVKKHMQEIGTNLMAFLQYKQQHAPGL